MVMKKVLHFLQERKRRTDKERGRKVLGYTKKALQIRTVSGILIAIISDSHIFPLNPYVLKYMCGSCAELKCMSARTKIKRSASK